MPDAMRFSRPTLHTVLVWTLTVLALGLLALVMAYWTLAWLAPAPLPRSLAPVPTAQNQAARSLFGTASAEAASVVAPNAPFRLLGVVASSARKRGYALVRTEGEQTRAVRAGQPLAPGLILAEVHANHLVLERNGIREVLTWPAGTISSARNAAATAVR